MLLPELLTLEAAARKLPGRPSVTTGWRWCVRGIATRTGERVRLRHRRLGRRLFVTEADLDAFSRTLAARAADALVKDQRPTAAGKRTIAEGDREKEQGP